MLSVPSILALATGRIDSIDPKNGKVGTMKNWSYEDGAKYVFSDAEVKAARKD